MATDFLHGAGKLHYFGDITKEYFEPEVLGNTVYISSSWIVDVLKGLIRHDHGALHAHFQGVADCSDQRRARALRLKRRTQRMQVYGIMHRSLLPYLWPAAKASDGMDHAALFREDVDWDDVDTYWGNIMKESHEESIWGERRQVISTKCT